MHTVNCTKLRNTLTTGLIQNVVRFLYIMNGMYKCFNKEIKLYTMTSYFSIKKLKNLNPNNDGTIERNSKNSSFWNKNGFSKILRGSRRNIVQWHCPAHSHGQSAFCMLMLMPQMQFLWGHWHFLRATFVTSTTGFPFE